MFGLLRSLCRKEARALAKGRGGRIGTSSLLQDREFCSWLPVACLLVSRGLTSRSGSVSPRDTHQLRAMRACIRASVRSCFDASALCGEQQLLFCFYSPQAGLAAWGVPQVQTEIWWGSQNSKNGDELLFTNCGLIRKK